MSDIQSVLADIQQKLNAPKGQFNKFGKYAYRNCEDILEAVKPLLGQSIITLSDEIVAVGARFYVKATATISLGSESISVSAFAREEENKKGMDSAQLTGSTSSYARKYSLNGLLLIDDNKDADSMNNNQSASSKPSADDLNWVNAIKSGSAKLEDINDANYRTKIQNLINQQGK